MNLVGLLAFFDSLTTYQSWEQRVNSAESDLTAYHLPIPARPPLVAKQFLSRQQPLLLIVGRVDAVPIWQQNLENWLPASTPILRFAEPTPLPYDHTQWSDTSRLERITVLTRLLAGQHPLLPSSSPPIIITSARALLHKTIPKRTLLMTLRVLKLGQQISLAKTLSGWQEIGYERVSVVSSPCQFSQRGGIIDIYPASAAYPIRMELFGEEIDTMRYFDPDTQRTLPGEVNRVVIPPAREALPTAGIPIGRKLAESISANHSSEELPVWQHDIAPLEEGRPFPCLEFYLPMLYPQAGSLLDYLPNETTVMVDDWAKLVEGVRDFEGHTSQMLGQQTELPPNYPNPLWLWDSLAEQLAKRGAKILGGLTHTPPVVPETAPLELSDLIQPLTRLGGQERPFLAFLEKAQQLKQTTVIVSRQAQRLEELWYRQSAELRSTVFSLDRLSKPSEAILTMPNTGSLSFIQGSLAEGFALENEHGQLILNLLSDVELFGWSRPAPRRRREVHAIAPETYFSDLEEGDCVVHLEYGIGRFLGTVIRTIGGNNREYLQLQYANGDILYVPVHHADRLSKWSGSEIHPPSLHRIGEKRWHQAKQQAQKAANDLAYELLQLYSARQATHGHAFAPDQPWQAELEASFPYTETEDQLKAIQEIKHQMEENRPMDHLLCGDVGFGKTEVALRAAFKAVLDNKQVAILVPTTILAQQHYETFQKRLKPFPAQIGILSRFQTPTQQHETIKMVREGSVDIVIGTHRLLSEDITFHDLGLLIIDEEQRFGVAHKEKLKKWRTEIDVLTMTATPIPRTLYMSLAGIRDISIINTPPQERLPVLTYVGASDDVLIKRALLRELDRGGQIFFVHNHIQTIPAIQKKLLALVPEARIGVGHGQMEEHRLEDAMRAFALHEVDILISTTIIENGLDIPNANTIIVDQAELFGLSQMYQLRGRVGRGGQRAYAYFFHSNWQTLTSEARSRLETIDEHQALGSGYSIAMRDLEIRGAGELLGGEQSGHISSVGFDLYMKMLAQAVKVQKAAQNGEMISAEIAPTVTIDLPLAAYMPIDYVPDPALRLSLYRRMAALESLGAIEQMGEELQDRFGPIPAPIENLLYQLRIKLLAHTAAKINSISSENGQIKIRSDLENIDAASLQHYLGNTVRVGKTAIWLTPNLHTNAWQTQLVQVLERFTLWSKTH